MAKDIIGWWSGGVTSAVACKLAQEIYGKDRVRMVFIDTKNEDEDTYRFLDDCKAWYGVDIETITSEKYSTIQEVWRDRLSLNISVGAVCSLHLKRLVRERWEKDNTFKHQVFGFDVNEGKRALAMKLNTPRVKAIFPLMFHGLRKVDCIELLKAEKVEIPKMYKLGFHNNNCFKTGCVQGGIGYWQKMAKEYPEKFDVMAQIEHELTDQKGSPVTMLKDQAKGGGLLFLKPHPDYPEMKDISMKKGREPKPLFECNGFCGTNDLSEVSKTYDELNLV